LTPVIENHFFSFESEHPQYGPIERIPFLHSHSYGNEGRIDQDKTIRHVKVRSTRNRCKRFGAVDGGSGEERRPGEKSDHARLQAKMDISLNPSSFGERWITNSANS